MSAADSNASAPPWGVIFDMDGVLVDSADAHWRSWELLAAQEGKAVSKDQFAATFGRQNRDIVPMFFSPVSPHRLTELADRKEAIYRDLIRAQPPLVKGASKLVHDLHRAGVALAVGSSGPRANIELVLEALGVRGLGIAIVSSQDVTRGKPDPQVFQIACRRLALPAARCVVIEDAPVGVAAARAAGTRCVAIRMHYPGQALAAADLIVPCLADISAEQLRALVEMGGAR
jgi:beta-phosphoglucomutase